MQAIRLLELLGVEHGCIYGLSSKSNTLLGVQNRSLQHMLELSHKKFSTKKKETTNLPHKGLDATGTAVDLIKSNLPKNF